MERAYGIADFGVRVGRMEKGPANRITDVPGVRAGHCTLDTDRVHTGVTVILPGRDNPYARMPVAAVHVLNGFGKSLGLMQVEELGTVETPLALTGTLNVGLVHDALVALTLERCREEGLEARSINPVVLECNDGRLSDSALRPVRYEHVRAAMKSASADFAQGAAGAGRGMICHGLKGGVGSASRILSFEGKRYTLGLLALANHGKLEDLLIAGRPVGRRLAESLRAGEEKEQGSLIAVLATDLPVDSRQLRRILRRAPVGMARLGSFVGHGSGEVFLGFTTANTVPREGGPAVLPMHALREELLDEAFRAAAECCEEAVLNALILADDMTGYDGLTVYSLRNVIAKENFSL